MWRASLVVILITCCVYARIPVHQLQVSGRILRSGSLSLPPSAGIFALESVTSNVSAQIRLRVRPLSGNVITIPMIARSNSPYELIVRSATDLVLKESETLRVGIGSVDAVAGRMHLMPDATSVLVTPGELAGPRDQIVVARGPRISRGGNDWTTDNAIRLTIEVQLPREVPEAELVVTMQFMGQ